MALEVYIDDSGTGNKPVFLLGGWIGRAEAWAAFTVEWREALKRPQIQPDGSLRSLDYFKMREANALQAQFHGWDREIADAKIVELVKIIKKHARSGISTRVMQDDYEAVMQSCHGWKFSQYFFIYHCLMTATLTFLDKNRIDESVDFIFDEQGRQSDIVQAAYATFMETGKPELIKRLGNRPIHRSDKDFLPLQAADLLAWNVRRHFYENAYGQNFVSPVMTALRTIRQVEDRWSRARLEDYMRGYRKSI